MSTHDNARDRFNDDLMAVADAVGVTVQPTGHTVDDFTQWEAEVWS